MSIRTSVFMLLSVLTFLFALAGYFMMHGLMFQRFVDLEANEARQDTQRWIAALDNKVAELDTLASDWSNWDDLYVYAVEQNELFVESNLVDETYSNLPLDILYIIATDGRVVYSRTVDSTTMEPLVIAEFPTDRWDPADPLLGQQDAGAVSLAGLVPTSAGMVILSARPILTSAISGPSHGTMLMGRLLTGATCQEISEATSVAVRCNTSAANRLTPDPTAPRAFEPGELTAPVVVPVDRDTLNVYTTVPDIRGDPAFLLCAVIPRHITAQGRQALNATVLAVTVSSLLLMLIMLIVLEWTVMSRLVRLSSFTRQVASGSDLALRIAGSGADELSHLAQDINRMLTSLERTQLALLAAERLQAELETIRRMTATYSHEINNPLTGIMATIQILQDEAACNADASTMLGEAYISATRIRDITAKMQAVSKPTYRPYGADSEIFELHQPAGNGGPKPSG